MGSAGTENSFVGNRGEFSSGANEHSRKRDRRRLMLTVAVVLFLSAVLTSCGGGFFLHPSISTMYVNPASATVTPSNTAQFEAYGIYSDGSTKKINENSVTWSSSDPTIATVSSPGGLVTGVGVGSATITATATVTVQGTGCQVTVSIANGSPRLSKTCYGNSTATLTTTINVNVTASDVNRAVINTIQGSTVSQSTATTPARAGSPAVLCLWKRGSLQRRDPNGNLEFVQPERGYHHQRTLQWQRSGDRCGCGHHQHHRHYYQQCGSGGEKPNYRPDRAIRRWHIPRAISE